VIRQGALYEIKGPDPKLLAFCRSCKLLLLLLLLIVVVEGVQG